MTSEQENRKNQHVSVAESFYANHPPSPFYDLRFVHHNFPMIDVADVDLSTSIGPLTLAYPFYINAMTGGSEWTANINGKLAQVAAACQIPMAVGSQSVAIRQPDMAASFSVVRDHNPDGLIFANIGANHDAQAALQAIDMVEADALQVHINAPQEIVMPEGDRDFHHWLDHFAQIIDQVDIPIIFKEVGFGFSQQAMALLMDLGTDIIDVGGRGGTNFAQIENFRRKANKYDDLETWGQTTPESLIEAYPLMDRLDIVASGGVKQPLDIVKSLALGARAVAMAGEMLHTLLDQDVDGLIEKIEGMKEELAGIYTLLGAKQTADLTSTDLIVGGHTQAYAQARGLDTSFYARRFKF